MDSVGDVVESMSRVTYLETFDGGASVAWPPPPIGGGARRSRALHAAGVDRKNQPHDLEVFRKIVDIFLVGTFNVLRLCAASIAKTKALAAGERGVIINTASVAAFEGQIGQVAYGASKGGVAAMTLPMARDLAKSGIRVLSVAPGIFKTPMVAAFPQEVQDALAMNIPFPSRLGTPEEFASLVCHMIDNSFLNGETVRLDGATRMQPR